LVYTLETKLKKTRESLVSRLNKKARTSAPDSTPQQQLSAMLNFRTSPAVMRTRRLEKNVPEVNVLLPERNSPSADLGR
jgi:hypothetical protein